VVQQEGASEGMLPGVLALEAHQHTFTVFRHLKNKFSTEIWAKNASKCTFFRKKSV